MTDANTQGRAAPTLEAVAARAGVSRATASRVLRGETNVSDEAREAVRAAARELSYTPNLAARSLVTGRSDSVAFLVDETQDRMFSDPFFLGMLRSAQAAVAEAGLQLVFTVTSRRGPRALPPLRGRRARRRRPADVPARPGRAAGPARERSASRRCSADARSAAGSSLYYVDADNVDGAQMATRHLLDSGRRVVATVTGPQDMCAGQDRLAGYRLPSTDAGFGYDETLIVDGEFSITSGYEAMIRLLAVVPTIDAVFAASDLAALGAIRAIEAAGRQGADEVAVVGFDDIRDAATCSPALTTIRQPIAEIGTHDDRTC